MITTSGSNLTLEQLFNEFEVQEVLIGKGKGETEARLLRVENVDQAVLEEVEVLLSADTR